MSTTTEPATDAAFWADADRHVLRYSPSFSPVVVERAAGSTLFSATAASSWTSPRAR